MLFIGSCVLHLYVLQQRDNQNCTGDDSARESDKKVNGCGGSESAVQKITAKRPKVIVGNGLRPHIPLI